MSKPAVMLTLSLLIFCKTFIFAQQYKFDVGFIGGPNNVGFVGNRFVNASMDNEFHYAGGLNLQYHFQHVFSITSGILFEKRGAASNIIITDSSDQKPGAPVFKSDFNYLVVPIMVKISVGEKVKVYFGGGGYAAVLLNTTNKSVSPNYSDSEIKADTLFRKLDFGISLNIGVVVPLNRRLSITLEGRNNFGVYNIGTRNVYSDQVVRTRAIELLLGISWGIVSR